MTIATDSPATEGQTPNAAPPSADKKPSETDSAKELAAAAAALQQASKSLADAAGKLPEKEPAEKKLVDGTVGFGERSGWNGLLLTFAEKEKKATAKASITTLHG
ncbi:MAG TPA: hypothetical protein VHM25_04195, partial [Polyangiaceae bacterium]|nr:hypothetical protein [Polyangiaceae bacterium]